MKPYNYQLLFLLLGAICLSCSKEVKEEESGPVSLTPHIAGISLTRAGIDAAEKVDAIGFTPSAKIIPTTPTEHGLPVHTASSPEKHQVVIRLLPLPLNRTSSGWNPRKTP